MDSNIFDRHKDVGAALDCGVLWSVLVLLESDLVNATIT